MAYSAPLSSASFFTPSLFAFNRASDMLADSTLKLSTGSRISRAGDDVAAFSIAARMQSQLYSLKQASENAVQGDSLLQVAQSGLEQILSLLDSMDALAAQSNSGSLSNTDRAYLQTQFSAYVDEIDRIAASTSFNNISLLNGNLSGEAEPVTTTTASEKATATILFSDNPAAAETVILNGATLVANTNFTVGGSTAATVQSLVDALNNSTDSRLSQASYQRSGDSIIITHDSGGTLGSKYTINLASSTADFTVPSGDETQVSEIYTLTDGNDAGLGFGSVVASGTSGDDLVAAQSQVKGGSTLTFTGAAANGELLRIDDGNGSTVNFTFATSAVANTDIQIGATTEETLQNIVDTLQNYSGQSDYVLDQLEFEISGNSITLRSKVPGNVVDLSNATADISETIANASLSSATLGGGSTAGVNVSTVNNKDFVGTVTGFSATYVGADSITASITVGDSTYTAAITDTTPTAGNATIRFTSTDGGYFDVELANNEGQTVSDQDTASDYASRLNAAFEEITFYQARPMSNFDASGAFVGASAKLQLSDFSEVRIESLEVTAPVGDDATIDVTINGEVFRANSGIGGSLGEGETITFTSLTDSNNKLFITGGSNVQDFSDSDAAETFEQDLRDALGLNDTGSGVTFQVGAELTDRVTVAIDNSSTARLFNGQTPSISTQANAGDAQDLIDTARDSVLSNLSKVGGLQSRFQSAQDLNSRIIEGVTSARSELADTDIAEEATNYALAALKVNSGVAVIAQTRQLQASLLTILNAGLNS